MTSLLAAICRNSEVLCKAARNLSGDLPGSTSSGMSQYERIIETLTTLFPVWVGITFQPYKNLKLLFSFSFSILLNCLLLCLF